MRRRTSCGRSGSYRLRGISDEHDLYQLVAPDLLDAFPPLRLGI
jgi:hypothetical protein